MRDLYRCASGQQGGEPGETGCKAEVIGVQPSPAKCIEKVKGKKPTVTCHRF